LGSENHCDAEKDCDLQAFLENVLETWASIKVKNEKELPMRKHNEVQRNKHIESLNITNLTGCCPRHKQNSETIINRRERVPVPNGN
jgi:hypothetical protein